MAADDMCGPKLRDIAAETTLRLGCPDSNDAMRGHDAKMAVMAARRHNYETRELLREAG